MCAVRVCGSAALKGDSMGKVIGFKRARALKCAAQHTSEENIEKKSSKKS